MSLAIPSLDSRAYASILRKTSPLIGGLLLAAIPVVSEHVWANPPGAAASNTEEDIVETDPKAAGELERQLLTKPRQLTFEGRRAGEGYFSADGTRLVFQSEREPGNPFFQIYVLDLETGDVERVSPGHGKTTCAWLHPQDARVLFASTQDDPQAKDKQKEEIEFRESGKERRYTWDYDQHYELYDFNQETKKYVNLTQTKGYDAEASWSPDGKLIAFTSNRTAHEKPLSAADQEQFELDPAYFNEIYLMNADGSNVRRLTSVPGYDGGPFFSPDGKKICWRRFTPNGAIAEVWTMDVDGGNQRQLTRLGAMSWAPYFHPSGKYLIFTTNRHGFANFELYMVAADGQSPPVRVSYSKGFDGLPAFSPDGTQLAWTTNRTVNKQSQLFISPWNHEAALKRLGLDEQEDPDTKLAGEEAKQARSQADARFLPQDILRHVGYLCRDELEGRLTGTRGEKMATAYVAAYFDSLGLQPAGDNGGWFQKFDFPAGMRLRKDNRFVANKQPLTTDKDWRPLSFSANGPVPKSGVVFAGYGIVAPESEEQEEYDSYVHLDVKDKWVVVFRYSPEDVPAERRQHLSRPSELRFKTMVARDRGARGLIIVSGPNSKAKDQLVPLRSDGALSGSSLPVLSVRDAVVEEWLKIAKSKNSLKGMQDTLDAGKMMMGFELKGVEVEASIDIEQLQDQGRNVLGRLQVGEQPSDQVVVVGAHIDHLGRGNNNSSLARAEEKNAIHYGADDNASGVAAMLEVAEYLASQKNSGKWKGNRDVIFAAWSGEEMGLIGSNHFVKNYLPAHPHGHAPVGHAPAGHNPHAAPKAGKPKTGPLPLKSNPKTAGGQPARAKPAVTAKQPPKKAAPKAPAKHALPLKAASQVGDAQHAAAAHSPHAAGPSLYPAIAACINMDMVGRMENKVVLQGVGSSSIWKSEIERRNVPVGLAITLQDDSYLPTDASSFYMQGVPILSAFTGSHSEYHSPRDTPDRLNYEGAAQIAKLMGLITRSLTMREDAPDYVAQQAPKEGQRKARLRAYLGTIPDYAEEVKGVLLSGASKNGPADKAGVKPGDVIVELAGKKIENIYDYTYAIEALKVGQAIKMVVMRKGRRITLQVTPGSRD